MVVISYFFFKKIYNINESLPTAILTVELVEICLAR